MIALPIKNSENALHPSLNSGNFGFYPLCSPQFTVTLVFLHPGYFLPFLFMAYSYLMNLIFYQDYNLLSLVLFCNQFINQGYLFWLILIGIHNKTKSLLVSGDVWADAVLWKLLQRFDTEFE